MFKPVFKSNEWGVWQSALCHLRMFLFYRVNLIHREPLLDYVIVVYSDLYCIFPRLERNQEREKGVSNMEYLKNVILKVIEKLLDKTMR